MAGLKNPHYYVALFIYHFGCENPNCSHITRKLRCVWAKQIFFSCLYNNSI